MQTRTEIRDADWLVSTVELKTGLSARNVFLVFLAGK
jgi:hypothetical protein